MVSITQPGRSLPSISTLTRRVACTAPSFVRSAASSSALPRIPAGLALGCAWLLVALLFPLYFALADVTYWAHVIRVLFSRAEPAFYAYHLVTFLAMLAFLGLPIGLSGALLPLLFHELRREVRDLGSVAGRLYAWNTLGSLLGALLGGYVLLFWLDLHHVYRIALAALIVGSAILGFLVLRSGPRIVPALVKERRFGLVAPLNEKLRSSALPSAVGRISSSTRGL